jgi:hypothetical protein
VEELYCKQETYSSDGRVIVDSLSVAVSPVAIDIHETQNEMRVYEREVCERSIYKHLHGLGY